MELKKSYCMLCSALCGTVVTTNENKIVKLTNDFSDPISKGYTCELMKKGFEKIEANIEITTPLKKVNNSWVPISWDQVLPEILSKLKSIDPSKILFSHCGIQQFASSNYLHALLRDYGVKYEYSFLSFERASHVVNGIFFPDIDSDLESSDVIMCIGKNLWVSNAHVRARTIINEKKKNGVLISVDPAVTETTKKSNMHIQLKPGTDAWFIAVLLKFIKDNYSLNTEWCDDQINLKKFLAFIDQVSYVDYLSICNVTLDQVKLVANHIMEAKQFSVISELGLNHSINQAKTVFYISMLKLLSGHINKKEIHNVSVLFGLPSTSNQLFSPVSNSYLPLGLIPAQLLPTEAEWFDAVIFADLINPANHAVNSLLLKEKLSNIPLKIGLSNNFNNTIDLVDYILPVTSPWLHETNVKFLITDGHLTLNDQLLTPVAGLKPVEEIVDCLSSLLSDSNSTVSVNVFNASPTSYFKELLTLPAFHQLRSLREAAREKNLWEWSFVLWFKVINSVTCSSTTESDLSYIIDQTTKDIFELNSSGRVQFSVLKNKRGTLAINLSWVNYPGMLELDASALRNQKYPFILACGYRRSKQFTNIIEPATPWVEVYPNDAEYLGITDGEEITVTTEVGELTLACKFNSGLQSGYIRTPIFKGVNTLVGSSNSATELNPTYKFQFASIKKILRQA